MQPMKVSVIGTNHAGCDFHLPGLTVFPDVEVSICDINEQLLQKAGDQFGIPVSRRYTDYRRMLDREAPEAVLVLMAQYPHNRYTPDIYFRIVNELLDQKRSILVEKPLAMTPAEAFPLVEKAEQQEVVSMVSFNRRFNPLVTFCRQAVERHGPIMTVSCEFAKHYDGFDKPSGDDWLTGDLLHALDLMRFLMGGGVKIHASMTMRLADDPVLTSFYALAGSESGVIGQYTGSVHCGARMESWRLHGAGTSAVIQTAPIYPMIRRMEAHIYRQDEKPVRYLDTEIPSMRAYMDPGSNCVASGFAYADRYFINCVRKREQPHCNFRDAYQTLCMCQAIINGPSQVLEKKNR